METVEVLGVQWNEYVNKAGVQKDYSQMIIVTPAREFVKPDGNGVRGCDIRKVFLAAHLAKEAFSERGMYEAHIIEVPGFQDAVEHHCDKLVAVKKAKAA